MSEKQYLSADELLIHSFQLAERVLLSGFEPTMIIAIWRGGVPIGIAVQEFLAFCGVETDHIAIRTSSYDAGIDQRLGGIRDAQESRGLGDVYKRQPERRCPLWSRRAKCPQ